MSHTNCHKLAKRLSRPSSTPRTHTHSHHKQPYLSDDIRRRFDGGSHQPTEYWFAYFGVCLLRMNTMIYRNTGLSHFNELLGYFELVETKIWHELWMNLIGVLGDLYASHYYFFQFYLVHWWQLCFDTWQTTQISLVQRKELCGNTSKRKPRKNRHIC